MNGAFDLAQIVDAGVAMSGSAGLNVIRYGDSGEQANDGGHDHDFNERKGRGCNGILSAGMIVVRFHCCSHLD